MRELVVAENPSSVVSESIKNVRTNLLFSEVDKDIKSVLVTSSVPSEGKSFIAANLALSFAQLDKRVLILDCDMRKGRQHELFNVSNFVGLSNLLLEDLTGTKKELEGVYSNYVVNTKYKKLDIVSSGFYPPNPSDMLSSAKFERILNDLSKTYDIVIIDGAPLAYLSDSLEIAKVVDKIVMVTSIDETPKDVLEDSVKKINSFKDKIAGVVVNKIELKKENNYYYKKEGK